MNLQADNLGEPRDRQLALRSWLQTELNSQSLTLERASTDASFRSYWRVRISPERTLIAMDAPPEKENSAAFIRVGSYLADAGLHTPKIYASDLDQGFVLMEDLGTVSYADALTPASADALYGDALSALASIARLEPDFLEPYAAQRFDDEMEIFVEWLVTAHLGVSLTQEQQRDWSGIKALLIDSALEQPSVFVHRDYHSRNLMVCSDDNPGVLDFQDALRGPITYDPVSLLRDCYVRWPEDRVDRWLASYRAQVLPLLPAGVSVETWRRWFDWMGVQRHLKAAGIFARLHHRDGKPGYLADIPRTMRYVVAICAKYRQLQGLGTLVNGLPFRLEQKG